MPFIEITPEMDSFLRRSKQIKYTRVAEAMGIKESNFRCQQSVSLKKGRISIAFWILYKDAMSKLGEPYNEEDRLVSAVKEFGEAIGIKTSKLIFLFEEFITDVEKYGEEEAKKILLVKFGIL